MPSARCFGDASLLLADLSWAGRGKPTSQTMLKLIHFCLPLFLGSAACVPTIHQFEASPAKVCKGQSSRLSWNATHGGSITASPPNDSPGQVFGQGTSVVTPKASGTYHLESKNVILTEGSDVRVEVTDTCDQAAAAPR
jgi:hypothetical protein